MPGHFHSVMSRILHGLLGRDVWVFMDGILIYESDPKLHCELVCKVLQALMEAGMIANITKFEVDTVDFLGFHLNAVHFVLKNLPIYSVTDPILEEAVEFKGTATKTFKHRFIICRRRS